MMIRETDTWPLEETDTLPLAEADMRPAAAAAACAGIPSLQEQCLKAMKTIGQALYGMTLYRVEHPSVAATIETALHALRGALELAPNGELRLALENQNLVVNGRLAGTPSQIQHSVLNLFNRFRLGRLTFREGLEYFEVEALCELAASRPDSPIAAAPAAFLAARGVTRVLLNDVGSGRR
jgi:hypothetical protein